jgi:hypothetical protein
MDDLGVEGAVVEAVGLADEDGQPAGPSSNPPDGGAGARRAGHVPRLLPRVGSASAVELMDVYRY